MGVHPYQDVINLPHTRLPYWIASTASHKGMLCRGFSLLVLAYTLRMSGT